MSWQRIFKFDIDPRTPDLRVRCPTDCATRPGFCKRIGFNNINRLNNSLNNSNNNDDDDNNNYYY